MNRRQGLLIALLLSVAINLLVAGALIGQYTRPEHRADRPPPLAWTAQPLPVEVRERVRRQLADRQGEVAPIRRGMRRAMIAVRRAATADPLDPSALKEALQQLRRAQQSYQTFLHDNMTDVVVDLPRDQRVALLRQMLSPERRPERRRPPPVPEHQRDTREP